jgi:thioredoxin-dependent peroxiredoxin
MKTLSLLLSAATLLSCSAHGEPLAVGSAAPALVAKSQNGQDIDLGEVFKKGVTLVYFYPKADTPGCTKQACNLRDFREDLAKAAIRVIGVSADQVPAQKAFEEKYKLNFDLIADADHKVIDAFGVPLRMGSFASRQSFLIQDGKVIWHQPNANPATQAQDAIAALAAAKKS